LHRWDPAAVVDLLALSPAERAAATAALAPAVRAVPAAAPDGRSVREVLVEVLATR
ncbi:MAG: hypothetical protein JWM05_3272, partial [Acidimicrobiales bacterium]|nr:hypothetical protein [Acidimicrobiales bacterium]